MSANSANDDFNAVVERLGSAKSLLLVAHARPDGDTLGSMAALHRAAVAAGRTATMLVPDDVSPQYTFLFPSDQPAGASRFRALAQGVDTIVVLDTCAAAQLDDVAEALAERQADVVVIDHHATEGRLGDCQWIDTTAAAVGVMVGELLTALDWAVDAQMAEALLTAALTDTGWLRFANTDGRCLRAVAELVDDGVRPDTLFRRIYQTDRPERLALLRCVLASLELHCDGRIAAMTIRRTDFATTGARPDETENLVNEALRLASVETAILLVENTDCVRVSLRSRDAVDVSAVARQFGGGGHKRAAGLRAATDVDDLRTQLIAACAARL